MEGLTHLFVSREKEKTAWYNLAIWQQQLDESSILLHPGGLNNNN